jgi:protoporphyrinogen/coproporphyrinogen III oxidase
MPEGRARVAVIGAGVSGLACAYRLMRQEEPPEVRVFERDTRPGGKIRVVEVGGLELPAGPDSFLARKPAAVELCKELGLGGDLVAPATTSSYLWTQDGLVPFLTDAPFGIPTDPISVFRWPGVSLRGRTRAAKDLVTRAKKGDEDESLGSLLRRRLGNEATERAIAPLLEGLFAGDADRLSVLATFPELRRWEKTQGSLIRGAQAAVRDSRRAQAGPMFLKPEGGVEVLVDALAASIGSSLRLSQGVEDLKQGSSGYSLRTHDGAIEEFDAVVLALPAYAAAQLLADTAPACAAQLVGITYASTGVVHMVYPEGSAQNLPDASGFVVPRDMAPMTAATFLSNKWPSARFSHRAVVRCYVGGVGAEDVLDEPDGAIVEACARHLSAVVPLPRASQYSTVVRWSKAMPQYEVGHLDLVSKIRAGLPGGIFVTGQAFDGVGIPDCIRAAGEAATAVLEHVGADPGRTIELHADEETVR